MTTRVEKITEMITKSVRNEIVTPENISTIIANVMESAQSFNGVSSIDKKKIVIEVMDIIIEDTMTDPEVSAVLKRIVPSTVDIINAASKGVFELEKKKCSLCG